MKSKKIKKTIRRLTTLIMLLLVGVSGWSLWQIINSGIGSFLGIFGIQSELLQNSIIVVSVLLLLIISGFGVFKAIEKLVS